MQRLHDAATPGEWRHSESSLYCDGSRCDMVDDADAAFIAAAKNAMPSLLQAARELAAVVHHRGEIDRLCASLAAMTAERDRAQNECDRLGAAFRATHTEVDKVRDADGEHVYSGDLADRVSYLVADLAKMTAERDAMRLAEREFAANAKGKRCSVCSTDTIFPTTLCQHCADALAALSRVATERDELKARLAEAEALLRLLTRRGGLGLDVHKLIDAYLERIDVK